MTIMCASSMARAEIDAMRPYLLIGLLVLVSCATSRETGEPRPSPIGAPAITLGPGWIEDRPALVVAITNRSSAPICIRADALRNPGSYEMEIRLRDARGRRVSLHRGGGYVPMPLNEIVRMEPGMRARGQYYLDRFKRIGPRRPLPNGWSAQAGFQYGDCHPREAYCDGRIGLCPDAWSSRATSAWQPLSFTDGRP